MERGTELKSSVSRRIFLSNFIVVFCGIVIFEIIFALGVKQFYYGGAQRILTEKASSIASFYNMYLKYESLQNKSKTILANYTDGEKAELQIVDNSGRIIASSSRIKPVETIDLSVIGSLKTGEISSWQGKIAITGEEVLAVTTPLVEGETISGYLRLVTSMESIMAVINEIVAKALIAGGLILAASLIPSMALARTIVRPIKHLTEVSRQIAGGNFDAVAVKKYDDEIGKLADTLNFMTSEIKKSNDLKNDFIASISHEIRTPLTAIRGWAETIHNNMSGTDANREGISIILKESERLTELVEELLDFSKYEAGRINMNFEKVDLNILIKDVLRQYSTRFKDKGLNLTWNPDNKITYITGDAGRLRQVFINLVDNAYKFSHENGSIDITTEKTSTGATVTIKDNGVGIPPDELSHVTDKFFKGKGAKSGSGLGLSISREITRLHDGALRIESIEGKGTTVTVELKQ